MKILSAPLLALALTVLPTHAQAQRVASARQPAPVVTLPGANARAALTRPINVPAPKDYPGTYWKEGAAIGAFVFGSAGALIAHGLCTGSDIARNNCTGRTFAGALVGGLTGVGLGALVGGLAPKGHEPVQ